MRINARVKCTMCKITDRRECLDFYKVSQPWRDLDATGGRNGLMRLQVETRNKGQVEVVLAAMLPLRHLRCVLSKDSTCNASERWSKSQG